MEIFASPRAQEVVVHDLRTPLNVIGLALRMLEDALRDCPELVEDIELIRSNAAELDRMLGLLVDVARVPADAGGLTFERFSPTRMVEDLIAEHRSRAGAVPVDLVTRDAPGEVELDYARAKTALQKALGNAVAAAGGRPVVVRLGGGPSRCEVAFEVAVPPRASVETHEVRPGDFQRIAGTAVERRGLDLSVAARISELFGGSARLVAIPGTGTALVLDWPASPRGDA